MSLILRKMKLFNYSRLRRRKRRIVILTVHLVYFITSDPVLDAGRKGLLQWTRTFVCRVNVYSLPNATTHKQMPNKRVSILKIFNLQKKRWSWREEGSPTNDSFPSTSILLISVSPDRGSEIWLSVKYHRCCSLTVFVIEWDTTQKCNWKTFLVAALLITKHTSAEHKIAYFITLSMPLWDRQKSVVMLRAYTWWLEPLSFLCIFVNKRQQKVSEEA